MAATALAGNVVVSTMSLARHSSRADLGSVAMAVPARSFGLKPSHLKSKCASVTVQKSIRRSLTVYAADASSTVAAEEVNFSWSGPGTEILLTGDFLNWEVKVPLVKLPNGAFSVQQKLPPGRYSYKFIVDGVWQHSPEFPTISDGAGGFNNTLVIDDPSKSKSAASEPAPAAAAAAAAPPAPKADGAPAGKKVVGKAVAGKAAGKKVVAKAIGLAMAEDVLPALTAALKKEEGVLNLEIVFTDNVLCGSFLKNGIPYNFWAFFPDGALDGSRGFSLTSYGHPPSTVEPFIIDERRVTPELLVFWITKRLFAQKMLALN